MIHHHHLQSLSMDIIFNFVRDWASWIDIMALFIVLGLIVKNKNLITVVIFFEFAVVIGVHEYLVDSGKYGGLIMQYIIGMGMKDIIVAFILTLMSGNVLIRLAYTAAAGYMLLVWLSYHYFYQLMFLDLYAARGTFVTLMMLLQVYGLTKNGGIKRNNPKVSNKPVSPADDRLPGFVWSNPDASIDVARAFNHDYKG